MLDSLERANEWDNNGTTQAPETGRNAAGGEAAPIAVPMQNRPDRPNHAEVANLGYESAALTS